MHILLVHQYFYLPGSWGNNRSAELAKHWVEAGHKVTVLTSTAHFPTDHTARGHFYHQFTHSGIDIVSVNVSYSHHMGFLRRIWAFILFSKFAFFAGLLLKKPDVYYCCTTPPTTGWMGMILAWLKATPFVLETIDVWPDVPEGMGLLKNRLILSAIHAINRLMYARAKKIVALSPGMRDQICSHSVDSSKVMVSYNGTDTEFFSPKNREADRPAHHPTTIMYAGTIGQANGLDSMVNLARHFANDPEMSDVVFKIVGDGNDAKRISKLIQNQGLKNIRIYPPVSKDRLLPLLHSADIGLVCFAEYPVLEANSANKFYDYLACGLPVLLNYHGWQAKILENHQCGFSSTQGDIQSFVKNTKVLVGGSELRNNMSANARKLAVSQYDRKRLAAELLLVLEDTVSKR